jgi:hypothetical protein
MALKECGVHAIHAENNYLLAVRPGAMAPTCAGQNYQNRRHGPGLVSRHGFPPMYPRLRN